MGQALIAYQLRQEFDEKIRVILARHLQLFEDAPDRSTTELAQPLDDFLGLWRLQVIQILHLRHQAAGSEPAEHTHVASPGQGTNLLKIAGSQAL